ncbi:MAG: DUF2116 family Zn-ribbon domain-containing protein [Thermoplasmata archaeon]|nr:DUF2116 family Zn-ribbon domain-containing protein [Thermoplasmata archaeon]
MVERIPQHRHCRQCDKAIPAEKQYCDENCENSHKEAVKSKKRQLLVFYIIMIIVFIAAVVMSFA